MILHANWAYMLPTVLVDAESALVLLKKSFVCLPYVSFQKQKAENQKKEKKLTQKQKWEKQKQARMSQALKEAEKWKAKAEKLEKDLKTARTELHISKMNEKDPRESIFTLPSADPKTSDAYKQLETFSRKKQDVLNDNKTLLLWYDTNYKAQTQMLGQLLMANGGTMPSIPEPPLLTAIRNERIQRK